MRIHSLSLHNFRNFVRVDEVGFPAAPLLVAAAPNATGKTNFLEAIIMLLRGRSFRSANEECVTWGADYFLVQGVVEREEVKVRLSAQYHTPSRKLRIEENGAPASPVTFYSQYPYILFLPDDAFMFDRGPAVRRNFLNTTLVASSHYLSAVVQYHRALRQRNAALKAAQKANDLAAWTELLINHATLVWSHREGLIKYLNGRINELYYELFGEQRHFAVQFVPGSPEPENFSRHLKAAWPHEKRYKYTLYGPHRDDLQVLVDGRPATAALSRGQIRGLVIALKVAAFRFVKQVTKQEPLLLFDEILSELDESRQEALLHHLPAAQTLLTCTSLPVGIGRREGVHLLDLRKIIRESTGRRAATSAGAVKVTAEAQSEPVPVRS